jgi:hypothetical protein
MTLKNRQKYTRPRMRYIKTRWSAQCIENWINKVFVYIGSFTMRRVFDFNGALYYNTHTLDLKSYTTLGASTGYILLHIHIIHKTLYLLVYCELYLPTVNNNNNNNNNIYNYFSLRRPRQCHQTIRDRLRPGNMTLQPTVI